MPASSRITSVFTGPTPVASQVRTSLLTANPWIVSAHRHVHDGGVVGAGRDRDALRARALDGDVRIHLLLNAALDELDPQGVVIGLA